MSQGRSTPWPIGDGRPPTFNDGNPFLMDPYFHPYGIGLMSLSPIIWKYRELIDPIAHMQEGVNEFAHMGPWEDGPQTSPFTPTKNKKIFRNCW